METIGFIGAGRVATALATSLAARGYPIAAVASRSCASAERLAALVASRELASSVRPDAVLSPSKGPVEGPPSPAVCDRPQTVADHCGLLFITTPDDAIAQVAAQVRWRAGQAVVHCSGALSIEALASAAQAGALTGGFHPMQSFASESANGFAGATVALEGAEPLLGRLKALAEALEARWIVVPSEGKALYHVAGVLVSNYSVALVKSAVELLEGLGVPELEARRALLALVAGTMRNIEAVGLPACLTGPIARGDIGTIERHVRELAREASALQDAYRALGRLTVPIALDKGTIDGPTAQRLLRLLSGPPETAGARRAPQEAQA